MSFQRKAQAEAEAQRVEEESNTETALLGNPLLNLAGGAGAGSEKVGAEERATISLAV